MEFSLRKNLFVIRLIVLISLTFSISYIQIKTGHWPSMLWLIPLLVFCFIELVIFHNKTRKEFSDFINAVVNSDFSFNYNLKGLSSTEFDIKNSYNKLVSVYRKIQEEKIFKSQFLKALIEHVDHAIVCFDENWKVEFLNKRIKSILGKERFYDISDFEKLDKNIGNAIKSSAINESELIRLNRAQEINNLVIRCSEFILYNKIHRIVSFQDISPELSNKEVESWKNVIRTITHEVNNTVIPITNLSDHIYDTLRLRSKSQTGLNGIGKEEAYDIIMSIETIREQGKGLVRFVNATRDFTKTLKPDYKQIELKKMLEEVCHLFKEDLKEKKIKLSVNIEPDKLTLHCDRDLLVQVFINLITNSIQAMEGVREPMIDIHAIAYESGSCRIEICDNGSGIEPENLPSIFVPYYTTRTDGSGIGLSVCKNIINNHKGSIFAKSTPGVETIFVITL